ncbi:MAG: type II CAAX endopeptidase family protein [Nanoarchaeota archaeon]
MENKGALKAIVIMILAAASVYITLVQAKNVLLTFIIYYGLFCVIVPLVDTLIIHRKSISDHLRLLGLGPQGRTQGILIGLAHGVPIYTCMLAAYFLLKDIVPLGAVDEAVKTWGIDPSHKTVIFAIMVLFNGMVEELLWRGYAYSAARDPMRAVPTIVLTSLIYTSYHMVTLFAFFGVTPLSLILVGVVLCAGILWGWMRERTGTVWASMIGHMLATAGYMTVYLLI